MILAALLSRWLVGVALAGGALAFLATARSWRSAAARRQCRELAARSGLTSAETTLVWRLGHRLSPEMPLLVFVRPSLLAMAEPQFGADPAAVRAIHAKLFG